MATRKKPAEAAPPDPEPTTQPPLTDPQAQLHQALARAVLDSEAVHKASKNKHHNYTYASSEHVLLTAREAMSNNGLAMVCVSFFIDLEHEKVVGTYELVHQAGGSLGLGKHDIPYVITKGRPIDKAVLGARTELLAYVARDTLLLPRLDANDDVSGRDDSDYVPPSRTQKQKPTKQPTDWAARTAEAKKRLGELKAKLGPLFDEVLAGHPKETVEDLEAAVRKAATALGSELTKETHKKRFWALVDQLGWSDQDASDDLHELYGATDASDLTAEQLVESIERLERNLDEANQ
jgi:hypothetical protein